nr:MAG TPA: hypothetical protein [Caudoviricetes sp.]
MEQELLAKLYKTVNELNAVLEELEKFDVYTNLGLYGQQSPSGFNRTIKIEITDTVKRLNKIEKSRLWRR